MPVIKIPLYARGVVIPIQLNKEVQGASREGTASPINGVY